MARVSAPAVTPRGRGLQCGAPWDMATYFKGKGQGKWDEGFPSGPRLNYCVGGQVGELALTVLACPPALSPRHCRCEWLLLPPVYAFRTLSGIRGTTGRTQRCRCQQGGGGGKCEKGQDVAVWSWMFGRNAQSSGRGLGVDGGGHARG